MRPPRRASRSRGPQPRQRAPSASPRPRWRRDSSRSRRSASSTMRSLRSSSSAVGSSASKSGASRAAAAAIATRCCSPPERLPARCDAREPRPNATSARCDSSATRSLPASRSESATFSEADSPDRRLSRWKTSATSRARYAASSRSSSRPSERPSTRTSPADGSSSPAARCSIVVFPHPEGPSTATKPPGSTRRSSPRRATVSTGPER